MSKLLFVKILMYLSRYVGLAFGNMLCGLVVNLLRTSHGWNALPSYRIIFFAYSGLGLLKLFLTFFLSKGCESEKPDESEAVIEQSSETSPLLPNAGDIIPPKTSKPLVPSMSKESMVVLTKLCVLFSFDSIASGLVPQ